jgi:hypothetical protein
VPSKKIQRATTSRCTRIIDDPASPDRKRVVMGGHDWNLERKALSVAAHESCEGCREPHFLPFGPELQGHHVFGRGGGRRDDRLWKPLQTIESEPNLARWRWVRGLRATCFRGHERLERMSTKEYRRGLLEDKCQCGLLRLSTKKAERDGSQNH